MYARVAHYAAYFRHILISCRSMITGVFPVGHMKISIIIALISLFLPLTLRAQSPWERVFSTTQQNDLFSTAFLSDREAVVVGDRGVIRITSDTGTTWRTVSSGVQVPLRSVAASPESGRCISVGDGGVIVRSQDRGVSWKRVVSNTGEDLTSVTFLSAETAIAVGRGGIRIYTTDGGVIWRHASGQHYDKNLYAVDAIDSVRAIAVGEGGALLKTSDGGRNWISLPPITNQNLAAIAVVTSDLWYIAGDSSEIFLTSDGGASWQKVLTNLSNTFNFHDVHFLDADTGYATGTRYLPLIHEPLTFYTTDGGISWTTDENGVRTGNRGIASYRRHGMIVGLNGTIVRFSRPANGTRHTGTTVAFGGKLRYHDIECSDPNNCIAVGDAETYTYSPANQSEYEGFRYEALIERTTDGGKSWLRQQSGLPRLTVPGATLNATDGIDSLRWFVVGDSGIVLYTSDGGDHWQQQESGTTNSLQDVCFMDPREGIAVGVRSTIIHTNDGGVSWDMAAGLPIEGFYNASAPKLDVFLVASGSKIYGTGQQDAQWHPLPAVFEGGIVGMYFLDSANGWVVSNRRTPESLGSRRNDYIARTTDGGSSWNITLDREIGVIPMGLTNVAFADRLNGLATGNAAKVLRSTDGGLSWSQEGISFISNIDNIGALAFPSPTHAIAGTLGGVLLRYDERLEAGYIVAPLPSKEACGVEYPRQPIRIDWSSAGKGIRYHLQISEGMQGEFDESNLILDEPALSDPFYTTMALSGHGTYYWRVRAYDDRAESDWSSVCSFVIAPSSGIADEAPDLHVALSAMIDIYPNPAHDLITIEFRPDTDLFVSMRLNDLQGHTVIPDARVTAVPGQSRYQIDISKLLPGLYYMRLSTHNQVIYAPILVVR